MAVATVRKAADPGVVRQVVGFLEDNALTRGWADAVGRSVSWVERQLATDDELRSLVGNLIARYHKGPGLSNAEVRLLETLKGAPVNREHANTLMAEHPFGESDYLGNAAVLYASKSEVPRDELKEIAANLQEPRNQQTELGHVLSTLVGHPAVAYGAVIAAGALGTAAASRAYDWWKAQQEQAEEAGELTKE